MKKNFLPRKKKYQIKKDKISKPAKGAWIQGCALDCRGEILAADQNVVLVSISYRLNLFGFFTGNFGLWDLIDGNKI